MNSKSGGWFLIAQLALATLLLGYVSLFLTSPIAQWGTDERRNHYVYLLAVGVFGFVCADRAVAIRTRGSGGALFWLALLLPAYAAFQTIPLPRALITVLSPARAELLNSLGPITGVPRWAPLAVSTGPSIAHLFLITAYAVVFFLTWQVGYASWSAVVPILVVAAVQAVFGLSQTMYGAEGFAHGTYPVRNHFAGFLEMALPFAICYAAARWARARSEGRVSFSAALQVCASAAIALLILLAVLSSLSRMGVLSCLASLAAMGVFFGLRGGRRLAAAGAVVIVAGVLFAIVLLAFLAPPELIQRFSGDFESGRTSVWRDTLQLINAYPVVGCGLGGYQSAYLRFKTWGPEFDQDYAHNDYLQFLAELGVVGFGIGVAFGLAVLWRLFKWGIAMPCRTAHGAAAQWRAIACAGSLAAILVHSAADFNLYVPANATLLAWICGLSAAQEECGSHGIADGSSDT
jgi:O-antigen ligase